MRVDICLAALVGLANASAVLPRDPQDGYSTDYSPEPDYAPEPEYTPEPGYAPEPEYSPAPDYAPEPEYTPQPAYAPAPVYSPAPYQPAYPVKPAYSPAPAYAAKPASYPSNYDSKPQKPWKPKTHHPEFFSLKIDQSPNCTSTDETVREETDACEIGGFAIRLENGIVIATPYNKWWDPKLPIFFVDDDTQAYTVSKKPLQLYVDSVTGALKYAPVGWLPANSISISFYKTGNNPMGNIGPSPAYFSWPTTEGRATGYFGSVWWFCPLSITGQYQVFISNDNFGKSIEGGVFKDRCKKQSLAAINANPWKKDGY